ncbi:MAG: hypothetical protein RL291_1885 [Pseudomonadota bacterium]
MAAYMIAFIDVKDPAQYAEYTKHTPRVLSQYGGRMIVRGGNPEALEGTSPGPRCVVVEFADRAAVKTFYESPAYQALIKVRSRASTANIMVVDGLDAAGWAAAVAESSKHG